MKKYLFLGMLAIVLCSFGPDEVPDTQLPMQASPAYQRHERIEYRIHYGFINAGSAVFQVHPDLYSVNGKVCYKTTVTGASSGSFDLVMVIRDTWGTYMDTATKIPQKCYRDIRENKYRIKEHVQYNYTAKTAELIKENNKGVKKTQTHVIPGPVHDIVSGGYFLRQLDYSKITPGTLINLDAFFEGKVYDFNIRFVGRETIDTKYGKIKAIKLQPVMPENELFDGGNSIRIWISDDANKLPLKIQADMFVGAVEVDLKEYSGLKHPIQFTK
jgi:hypothetical protein